MVDVLVPIFVCVVLPVAIVGIYYWSQINAENKKILVVPTSSKDKDAIKWVKKTNPLEAKKFSCPKLTDNLYDAWNWDKDYIYRATGRLVTVQNKVMLYFDFSEPEKWKKPEAKDAK